MTTRRPLRRETDLRRGGREQPEAGGGVGCPACGHHLSAAVGGSCSVFVPLPPGGEAHAGFCGCDCYRAVHGESLNDRLARHMHPKEQP